MRGWLRRWVFFTALALFLLAAAVLTPEVGRRLFGQTGDRVLETARRADAEIRAVWAEYTP